MGIILGTNNIEKIYLGEAEVSKIYLGDTLVFEANTPEQIFTFTIQENSRPIDIVESALPYSINENGTVIATIREDDGTYIIVDWNLDGVSYPTYISVGQASSHENLSGKDWTIAWVEGTNITINSVAHQASPITATIDGGGNLTYTLQPGTYTYNSIALKVSSVTTKTYAYSDSSKDLMAVTIPTTNYMVGLYSALTTAQKRLAVWLCEFTVDGDNVTVDLKATYTQ